MTVKRPRSKIIAAVVGATALGTVCQFLGGAPAIAAPIVEVADPPATPVGRSGWESSREKGGS